MKITLIHLTIDTDKNRYRCELGGSLSQFLGTMANALNEDPTLYRAVKTVLKKVEERKKYESCING